MATQIKNKMDEINIRHCNKCNKTYASHTHYLIHCETELHKTGQRKKRSDTKEPYKCEHCEYKSKNLTTFKMHKLNYHSSVEEKEKEFKYYCKECDYGCFYEEAINKHNNTIKHKYNMTLK